MAEEKSDQQSSKSDRRQHKTDDNRRKPEKFSKEKGKAFAKRSASGDNERHEIKQLNQLYQTFDFANWETFREAPLSVKTKAGLERSGFAKPTRIQRETLGLALRGVDVLGAAKTGSGKTLAFVVPILEILFREMWTRLDGLGALVITPTRELAYQIFEVLKKVGIRHDFSAGLIIGGTEVGFERKRLQGCNIIICTPGRLLQHMDQNPLMDPTNLKILVLDEADRILDMGFQRDMNAILENLPPDRQTLLFSATQTKSVKDLARLSLRNPSYISVHEKSAEATPEDLSQDYLVCELHDKLSLLWSFLKSHKSKKIIVFMSCCKQVQFINTIMRRMRPGTTVLHLHGNMSQPRRMAIYDTFCSKQSAILLATDLAARGLDFPKVDWVMQLDCPEDTDTYIHRVGRTARFGNSGNALLVLLPTEEESMVQQLIKKKIPVNKIDVNPRRFYDIQRKVEAMCARDVELKASAQRSFVGYLKYIFMQKDKHVFQVEKLDLDLYARSLGLIITPRVRFLEKYLASKGKKIVISKGEGGDKDGVGGDRIENTTQSQPSVQLSRRIEKFSFDDGLGSDDEIFTKGKLLLGSGGDDESEESEDEQEGESEAPLNTGQIPKKNDKILTKVQAAKKILKKKHIVPNKKVVFDEEGEVFDEEQTVLGKPRSDVEEKGGINIELSKQLMKEQDRIDKQIYRDKVKAKHREDRLKAKAERRAATLGGEAVLDVGGDGSRGNDEAESDVDEENMFGSGSEADDGRDADEEHPGASKRKFADGDSGEDECIGSEDNDDDSAEDDGSCSNEELSEDGKAESQRHVPRRPMEVRGKFGLKRRKVSGIEELDTGLTLAGDEELALKLLQS